MRKHYPSFAKINLFLYITSKREDGYHNLCSLMTQIDLCDDIYLDFTKKDICVTCDHPNVPDNESNLAFKAAQLFYRSLKLKTSDRAQGLSIEIVKRIPVGGGLGGGSSNAACVLTALNHAFKTPFSKPELMRLGLTLGADVPFFMIGGPAIARGLGEKLEKVTCLRPCHLVLCHPGMGASTAKVYKSIDFRLTLNQKYNRYTGLNVPLQGQGFDLRSGLHNDLEESACRLYPVIKETKQEMEWLLQRRIYMTGSGSSLFALFSDREKAEQGYTRLAKEWANSSKKVFVSSFH